MVCYLLFWTPLREVVFGLVCQSVRETAAWISPWGYADTWHMSRRQNWFGFWEILNFNFRLVFWHTGHQPSSITDTLMSWCGGRGTGRGWKLLTFLVCVLFITLCQVKSVCFVVRILDVHSAQQKSIGLIFHTSRPGSHVTYSCHHNSSRFAFPINAHSWLSLSSIHYKKSHRIYINRRQRYICFIWN